GDSLAILSAKNELSKIELEVKNLENLAKNRRITAPISGYFRENQSPEEKASFEHWEGEPVVKDGILGLLANNTEFDAIFVISEFDIHQFHQGQQSQVTLLFAPNIKFE